jgi:hypothetical protein
VRAQDPALAQAADDRGAPPVRPVRAVRGGGPVVTAVRFTPEEIARMRIDADSRAVAGVADGWNPARAADRPMRNLYGVAAETAVARLLRLPDSAIPQALGADGGADLTYRGLRIQVKFNRYPSGDLYVADPAETLRADVLALVTPLAGRRAGRGAEDDLAALRVAGWISAAGFRAKARRRPWMGSAPGMPAKAVGVGQEDLMPGARLKADLDLLSLPSMGIQRT